MEHTEKIANKKIKALLVDDNYEFFSILSFGVKEAMDLDYACDGFTAFKMMKKGDYDVVICDVYMPLLDGISLLAETKKKNIHLPFVFVSGNIDEKVTKEAFHVGAYNLIEKPFEAQELVDKVSKAIELHQTEEAVELSDQDKAHMYNTLKMYYYDVDRILRAITHFNIPVSAIYAELDKKALTGRCVFDDLHALKYYKVS
jgi:Response regulator containing CheY-like receiver, AAA-type ATPase, and DNA-binding domains